jgi:hypothetical protein
MKNILALFLLLLCFCTKSLSQGNTDGVIYLSKIPPEGFLLDKGWKFHAGDDPSYAAPDFDDSKWQTVDPTKDIHDLPSILNNKIVWFRLFFEVDTAINRGLAMQIEQAGASEMYMNGKLIHRFWRSKLEAR